MLSIPATRVKNKHGHEIPLAPQVVDQINSLPREGEYVFSTCYGKRPISGFSKMKRKLDELSGVTDMRIHDLRRVCASGMSDSASDSK